MAAVTKSGQANAPSLPGGTITTMDPLDDLRDTLARQRAHLEQHGFLYDTPSVEPDQLAWAIREIERLRRELNEARAGRDGVEPDPLEGVDEIVETINDALEHLDLPAELGSDGIRVVVALDAEGTIRHYKANDLVKADGPTSEAVEEALLRGVLEDQRLDTDPKHDPEDRP